MFHWSVCDKTLPFFFKGRKSLTHISGNWSIQSREPRVKQNCPAYNELENPQQKPPPSILMIWAYFRKCTWLKAPFSRQATARVPANRPIPRSGESAFRGTLRIIDMNSALFGSLSLRRFHGNQIKKSSHFVTADQMAPATNVSASVGITVSTIAKR
jgi:hypothetical protein